MNSDFTEQEIREFEEQWQVPVLRIANVTGKRLADGRSLDGRSGVMVGDFSFNPGIFCSVFGQGKGGGLWSSLLCKLNSRVDENFVFNSW